MIFAKISKMLPWTKGFILCSSTKKQVISVNLSCYLFDFEFIKVHSIFSTGYLTIYLKWLNLNPILSMGGLNHKCNTFDKFLKVFNFLTGL
jgi:hypothetical protein